MENSIGKFIKDQLSVWPLAAENYRNLKRVRTKTVDIGGLGVTIQYNPCRKISSEASLDKESIASRPCFLCPENRPPEQYNIDFEGRKGRKYRVTLNPYPIFPSHLVISSTAHIPQSIWHRYQDSLDFVRQNQGYCCFYNGPASGASAPDHMHFQACPSGLMPLQAKVDSVLDGRTGTVPPPLASVKEARLYHLAQYVPGVFFLHARTAKSMTKLFYRLLDCAPVKEGDSEPRFNLVTWFKAGEYRSVVVFREKHRSHHYCSTSGDHLAMSPGCADMAGVFICTREEDFDKVDGTLLGEMLAEVSVSPEVQDGIIWRLTRTQRTLEVGVMSGDMIEFEIVSDGAGPQRVSYKEGRIEYNGALYDELTFEAQTESTMFAEPSFILYGVTIGVDFHWQRKVTQRFAGTLKFIVENNHVTAVNVVGVEDYLLSVISSEMKSSAGLEFLKAHAVISRSWVMAQVSNRERRKNQGPAVPGVPQTLPAVLTHVDSILGRSAEGEAPGVKEYIKWFDHEDHTLFDVCADDHCQRYQGLSMAVGDTVRKAIDQTWGMVLVCGTDIVDARFSKCCGGIMETFGTCWEDKEYPYLRSLPDTPGWAPGGDPFCNTSDERILSQVLNDYDLETRDFYRWTVRYSRDEVSSLVARRSGLDFGEIQDLIPLERGGSGRISKLKVVGSKMTMVIGKELIIRRWLSESHLKSSAFDVSWEGDTLVLDGKGWGHGVGLCQIGAAVMASRGFTFEEILSHYYPGSTLLAESK